MSAIVIKQPETSKTERGFILIPVLWVLALLALVCAILTRTVSNDIRTSKNLFNQTDAELLSDGIARLAIRYVAAKGVDDNQAGIFNLNGDPRTCAAGGNRAVISVTMATGLVDVNLASQDVLEKLYAGVGADAPAALAAATVDFRDGDNSPSPQGAEGDAYLAAGLPYGPKNAEFSVVEEIDQVLGMTPDVAYRASQLLTTHSHLELPDASVAVPQVSSLGLPTSFTTTYRPKAVRILVSVNRAGQPHIYSREAVVVLQPRVASGFVLTDWSRPEHGKAVSGEVSGESCVASLLALDR